MQETLLWACTPQATVVLPFSSYTHLFLSYLCHLHLFLLLPAISPGLLPWLSVVRPSAALLWACFLIYSWETKDHLPGIDCG